MYFVTTYVAEISVYFVVVICYFWGRCPPLGGAYSGFLRQVGGAHPLYATAQAAARHNQKRNCVAERATLHYATIRRNKPLNIYDGYIYHTKVGINDLYD